MSQIKATITKIENVDSLNIVTFDFLGTMLSMMSLELSKDIKIGTKVMLGVKPTHVAIAKDFDVAISFSNQIKASIISISHGELLSSINLDSQGTFLESIITKKSALRLGLEVGDEVTLLIKASELSIVEVLNV